ncbi:PQQ-dependent sugar dehydrogenase [Luteolibacter sp. Populi]|uniref:PQQ-dependent sugar dehydrogenase n=1 Tax=Luteolibacter sp. Populi TaxID=3230487 RepID=UPI00346588A9
MRRASLAALLLPSLLGAALADPLPLRQANPALNVPAAPPATSLQLVNAFAGLTFSEAVCIASPPGDSKRLFVCERTGKIWLIPDVTATSLSKVLFMDLALLPTVKSNEALRTNDTELGLLGLAFHPNYASNRHFYLAYSVNIGSGSTLFDRLSRFTAQAGNPNAGAIASELVYLDQRDNAGNHNGGDIHFGPEDGYLYYSVGDEGNQADQQLNAQRVDKDFFSGILRIDVDKLDGNLAPNAHPNPNASVPVLSSIKLDAGVARYSIPLDNPLVGATTFNGLSINPTYLRTEFWATGLRNPWRFSFDPLTKDLWCGDVGGFNREEVNKIVRGGNYGWVYREGPFAGPWGTHGHPAPPAGFTSIDPVYHYSHSEPNANLDGDCIIGGIVYRGGRVSSLYGKYLFADHGSGNVWSMNLDGTGVTRIFSQGGISAFGVDPSNQDALITVENGSQILRIISNTTIGAFPDTLTETGLFSNVADLAPAPGLIPYTVNLPFWSDHAIKTRWFTVPNPTATFTGSQDGLWTLPTGTVWVKHFEMEMERGVAASRKRIETRLIVKNASGAYGVSYKWNAGGTEAAIVEDGGESFTLNVTDGGNPVPQVWNIPARGQCMICHTTQAGHALSFNTRQLNLENDMSGHTGNQLSTLFQQGYLSGNPGSPRLLPRHLRPDESDYSVEGRVRSYLAVNCSYCHKAGGTGLGNWDGRPELTLTGTGLVNGSATNDGGNEANKLVVPGDTQHSIVLNRVAVTNGFTRMPPLASNVIDTAAASLLTTWINGDLATRQTYDAWRISHFEPDDDPAGEAATDADGDGTSNRDEFLAGTDPQDGTSNFRPLVTTTGTDSAKLSFTLPVNRSFRIETTSDFGQWTPWDIPGNQPLPRSAGIVEFTFPLTAEEKARFFRMELREH